jgi:hypothetical protein
MKRFAVLLLLFGASLIWAQKRFPSGELKGFTESPAEGVIIHLEQPFVVQEISGVVLRSVGDESPLEGVLFELRGPGNSAVIRSAKTGIDGNFNLSKVPQGKYTFKVTALGFQSIVGVIIVSSKAASSRIVKLSMRPGV